MREPFAQQEWIDEDPTSIRAQHHGQLLFGAQPAPTEFDADWDPSVAVAAALAGGLPEGWSAPELDREGLDGCCLAALLQAVTGRPHRRRRVDGADAVAVLASPGAELVIMGPRPPSPLFPFRAYLNLGPAEGQWRLGLPDGPSWLFPLAKITEAMEGVVGGGPEQGSRPTADACCATDLGLAPRGSGHGQVPAVAGARCVPEDGLGRRIQAAAPGATVEVPAGVHRGRWVIDKPLVLRGTRAEATVLDGAGRGPILSLEGAGEVHLEELTLRNGRGRSGGAVVLDSATQLHVSGCLFLKNGAPDGRGGAISGDGGALTVRDSAFAGNLARVGGALATHGETRLRVERVVFSDNTGILGGALAIGGSSDAELEAVRFERSHARRDGRHLYLHTTPNGAPRVSIGGSLLLPGQDEVRGLAIVGQPEPAVYLERSAIDRGRGPFRRAV